ncbi:MAG: hypothetical protein ACJAYU_003053 [Bradymonadia bacterium]|jgi:hypothetical protein
MRLLIPTLLVLAACEVVTPTQPLSSPSDTAPARLDVSTATDTLDIRHDTEEDLSSISLDALGDAAAADIEDDVSDGDDALSDAPATDASDAGAARDIVEDTETDAPVTDVPDSCDLGTPCRPIAIENLPFSDSRDTRDGPTNSWDAYACAPSTDESGPEWIYQVEVRERGTLHAAVIATSDGADPDVHILRALDPAECIERGHTNTSALLDTGTYYIVVDTWVDGDGVEYGGRYTLNVSFSAAASGNCSVETDDLRMFWTSCASSVGCFESGGDRYLRMPATGPVVREAHLVTSSESFPSGWPTSSRAGLEAHYALSERATGYPMVRGEPWAPAGEGGSRWGQGSTGSPVPVMDEAWYVNMYWRTRPSAGTRIIVTNPANGRSVVASGGYETGPGANTAIGGAVEEIHHHLGTTHLGTLTFGFAVDQSLPLGPIVCD